MISRRRLKPLDWGRNMTVCISVACDCDRATENINPKLILISDTLLSLGLTSVGTLKGRALSKNWDVMFAGDDVTYVEDVIGEARKIVAQGTQATGTAASNAMVQAYQAIRRQRIEETYLKTYGWDMAEFLRQGPEVPTASHRQYLLNEIDKFDLGCQFLVLGFSTPTSKYPQIFEIDNPGRYVPRNIAGYAAIGSGWVNAFTYLARRNQGTSTHLGVSFYNAVAAKRLAEKALGVGGDTAAIIIERGQESVRWVGVNEVNAITTIWLNEEANIRPKDLDSRVQAILNPPSAAAGTA